MHHSKADTRSAGCIRNTIVRHPDSGLSIACLLMRLHMCSSLDCYFSFFVFLPVFTCSLSVRLSVYTALLSFMFFIFIGQAA